METSRTKSFVNRYRYEQSLWKQSENRQKEKKKFKMKEANATTHAIGIQKNKWVWQKRLSCDEPMGGNVRAWHHVRKTDSSTRFWTHKVMGILLRDRKEVHAKKPGYDKQPIHQTNSHWVVNHEKHLSWQTVWMKWVRSTNIWIEQSKQPLMMHTESHRQQFELDWSPCVRCEMTWHEPTGTNCVLDCWITAVALECSGDRSSIKLR